MSRPPFCPGCPHYPTFCAGIVAPALCKANCGAERVSDPAPSEAEKLLVVAGCEHARLPGCGCGGIECAGGARDGQRVSIKTCKACPLFLRNIG
ncbi:hypothetical protein [Singulisphaera sp. PoT]|uniref:hypothetical protein n=1 Tax=Singulisphaera sp. PoT TaxID=3411797 RepID=UPI003BF47386